MLLCANTMHIIANQVQSAIDIPLLHIAKVVLADIKKHQFNKVLLLGTKYTMQSNFYKDCLQPAGIEILLPDINEMEIINDSIYNELGKGIILPQTRQTYIRVIEKYINEGAQGIILGCTEIPLLIKPTDCSVPIFDTTLLHATAAVNFALS